MAFSEKTAAKAPFLAELAVLEEKQALEREGQIVVEISITLPKVPAAAGQAAARKINAYYFEPVGPIWRYSTFK